MFRDPEDKSLFVLVRRECSCHDFTEMFSVFYSTSPLLPWLMLRLHPSMYPCLLYHIRPAQSTGGSLGACLLSGRKEETRR
jgi:hypothetical protein